MRKPIRKIKCRNASLLRVILLLAIVTTVAGCKVKRPHDVLAEGQMQDIVYDLQLARTMGEQLPYAENYKKRMYMEYVYSKHGVTEAKFDSSLVWYTRHTELLANIYKQVAERLKKENKVVSDRLAAREGRTQITPQGDSINVWMWMNVQLLTGTDLNNRMTFTLPADTNFRARDSLAWQVEFNFLNNLPDSAHAPYMALQMHLSTDSVLADICRVYANGAQVLSLQPDTALSLKEVSGFVYYPSNGCDSLPRLLLHDIKLMRYHAPIVKDSLQTDSLQTDSLQTDSMQADALKRDSSVRMVRMPREDSMVTDSLKPGVVGIQRKQ